MLKALNSRARYLAIGFHFVLTAAFLFYPYSRLEAIENSNTSGPSQDPGEQAGAADALLEAGNTLYMAGDLRNAEKNWIEVRSCPRTSSAWPKAVYNLGLLEMKQANYPKAIGYFNEVLQSHPNDKEPGANIMQVYRNYSNRSALQVSMCYEKMADYRQALHYAWLAKSRYPYLSWCGTCLQSANFALNKRIAYLSIRAYRMPFLAVAVIAVTFFSWKKLKTA
jgi:tetratricopeptide (TPR) repeat protein